MFTGIIEQLGTIERIEGHRFVIAHAYAEPFVLGESIALNGMCATVVAVEERTFAVDIIGESRKRTTFGAALVGGKVNLERAAKVGQRNSGHHVTGHIDEVGTITKLEMVEDFWLARVQVRPKHRAWLVQKGSVALAGISLTVSGVSEQAANQPWFEVSIIPYTWEHTTLKQLSVGDGVNVEFDILGKYHETKDVFDVWNEQKKQVQELLPKFEFKERHIIFMRLGKNIGFEQDGKGEYYLRPVVVIRKFNKRLFWGVPLTSRKPDIESPYYFYVGNFNGKDNWAILSQGRAFDIKRAQNKLGLTPQLAFTKLVKSLEGTLFKTPPR